MTVRAKAVGVIAVMVMVTVVMVTMIVAAMVVIAMVVIAVGMRVRMGTWVRMRMRMMVIAVVRRLCPGANPQAQAERRCRNQAIFQGSPTGLVV